MSMQQSPATNDWNQSFGFTTDEDVPLRMPRLALHMAQVQNLFDTAEHRCIIYGLASTQSVYTQEVQAIMSTIAQNDTAWTGSDESRALRTLVLICAVERYIRGLQQYAVNDMAGLRISNTCSPWICRGSRCQAAGRFLPYDDYQIPTVALTFATPCGRIVPIFLPRVIRAHAMHRYLRHALGISDQGYRPQVTHVFVDGNYLSP